MVQTMVGSLIHRNIGKERLLKRKKSAHLFLDSLPALSDAQIPSGRDHTALNAGKLGVQVVLAHLAVSLDWGSFLRQPNDHEHRDHEALNTSTRLLAGW